MKNETGFIYIWEQTYVSVVTNLLTAKKVFGRNVKIRS